ncbi:MAG: amidohydrolase/deacetylase family metallohydrolase [Chloroflexota bacterium]
MAFFDTILRGATVVDPSASLFGRYDVGLAGGKIMSVAPDLPKDDAKEVLNLPGLYITPGLIDLHTHAYWGGTDIGVDPDRDCLPRGVTTMVDAGSAGAMNFLAFRKLVLERSSVRLLAFLNLASIGQVDPRVGEYSNMTWLDLPAAGRCIEENRDYIIGLKVRLSRDAVGQNGLAPLEMARELADRLNVKVMAHVGETDAPLGRILDMMRAGDVVSHFLTPRRHGIVEERGKLLPEVRQAVARGVWFDVAQGRSHLGFAVARAAFKAGLLPHTISTDVTRYGLTGAVKNLPNVLSCFLALGLSLQQVVERATSLPAKVLGLGEVTGSLRPGLAADLAVFALEEGQFEFADSTGATVTGKQRLAPKLVFKDGVPTEGAGA